MFTRSMTGSRGFKENQQGLGAIKDEFSRDHKGTLLVIIPTPVLVSRSEFSGFVLSLRALPRQNGTAICIIA